MATLRIQARAGNSTLTRIRSGRHIFFIDEPPSFGGEDLAPSPVEMLLASLAGALNAIGQYVAREMSMPLRGLDIQIDGDCDAGCFFGKSFENRAGFQEIRVTLAVDTDAPPDLVERWKEQVLLRCPVLDNLTAPVRVETVFRPAAVDRDAPREI